MNAMYLRFPGGKAKALTFSYDDGVDQDIRLIDIFRKHGMRATFNINGGQFSPEGKVFPAGQVHRRMSASQVKATYTEDVCEVACHAYTHPHLTACSSAVVCNQIMEDRKALEAIPEVPTLTPHSCRHTYVSQMQALGVDLSTIQSIVGHADVDMTAHYLHLQEPKRQEAIEKFSTAFAVEHTDSTYVDAEKCPLSPS